LTATVTIDKDAVSIVGIGANACPTGGAVGVAITNLDAFDIQADKVRIENMRIHMKGTGSAVKVTGETGIAAQLHLKNVGIIGNYTGCFGVEVVGDMYQSTIEQMAMEGVAKGIVSTGSGTTRNNVIRDIYMVGAMDYGIQLPASTRDVVHDCTINGATASIGVTGATSTVHSCRVSVAISDTALAGNNTTVA
jgi:hypothetical protein